MSKEIKLPQQVEILRTFKHLGVIEVTSKTQKKNGTRRFKLVYSMSMGISQILVENLLVT